MFQAVIFDMDGVLIDSEPLHFKVDELVLRQLQIDEGKHYLERFVGYTNPAMWKIIRDEHQIENSIDDLIDLQMRIKLDYLDKSKYAAIDGVLDLLKNLRAKKIPLAIASSSPRVFIEAVVEKIQVSDYFNTWISGEEVQESKPAPDVFLKAAELLGVQPMNCLVIEDSKSGTIAAKSAGMKCVGYKNPNSGNQDLSCADLIVGDFNEISLTTLENLFSHQ
jgi:HAD superfamily hydrolase (TIGR01509 family)